MLEKQINNYYDSILPSNELIERTITMANNTKRIKLSKRAIAIIIAAIILLMGTTGYATINRILNDDKNIVSIDNGESLVFDFSKAANIPNKYSDNENKIIKEMKKLGYDNVLLPNDLLKCYEIESINPFITESSNIIDFKNEQGNTLTLSIVDNLKSEDKNNFIGTGDESTKCEAFVINGIDIFLSVQGDDEIGYMPYIFYTVDDAIYCINYYAGNNLNDAYENGVKFIKSLEE